MTQQADAVRQQEKRRARMEQIDALPKAIRELVHEYNWTIVDSFLRAGLTRPNQIRHLIQTVLQGADAYGCGVAEPRDGERLSTRTILEIEQRKRSLVLAPREPSEVMIRASMDAVPPYDPAGDVPLLSKREKHRRRLRAALAVGDIWAPLR